jgi:hypothetical protein
MNTKLTRRHSRLAHALTEALASSEVSRIVARCADAEAADGETWIECESHTGTVDRISAVTGALIALDPPIQTGRRSQLIEAPMRPNYDFELTY